MILSFVFSRKKTVYATIVSKKSQTQTHTAVGMPPLYNITVVMDNGSQKVLDVPKNIFYTLSVGQKGLLTFTGYNLLEFNTET